MTDIAKTHESDQKRLSEIVHRIGTALGKELGGRFYVLGNVGKEEKEGSPTRTLKIVDRWGADDEELSCIVEVRKRNGRN